MRLFLRVFRIVIYRLESTTRISQHHVFCLSYLMKNVQLVQGHSELNSRTKKFQPDFEHELLRHDYLVNFK